MFSSLEHIQPTAAQRINDHRFVESVSRELVPPICDELESLYPDYRQMNCFERLECVIAENEKTDKQGDALIVEYHDIRFLAYAGVELGPECSNHDQGEGGPYSYRPLFENTTSNDSFPRHVYHEEFSAFAHLVTESTISQYVHESSERRIRPDATIPWGIPKYSDLPIAYRVALVCQYVNESVLAVPDEITEFALGYIDTLETHRVIVEPTANDSGVNNGWVVRIRDLRPSQEFGMHLASYLRDLVTASERLERGYNGHSQFEQKPPPKRRATSDKTLTMVAHVDDLKARGVTIGRGGDKTWDEVAAELAMAHPGLSYTGRNLRDSYNSYKKRHANEG